MPQPIVLPEPKNRKHPEIPTRAHIAAELAKIDKRLEKQERKGKIKDFLGQVGCSQDVQDKILDDLESYPEYHAR